jgi:hypothetical protein
VLPEGNVRQWTYDAAGFVAEHRRKTADGPDSDANDIVETWKTDAAFGVVLRYLEPRANEPGLPAADKVALTRSSFYDHEDIELRLESEANQMGAPVTIAGSTPVSFGRTGAGLFPEKSGGVFDDADGDGLPDRGGNLWIARDPSPKVVDGANPSQFLPTRQAIERFCSYNQHGQPIAEVDPSGDVHRWQYYSGTYNQASYPNAGFLFLRVVDSGLTAADLDLATGDPTGSPSEPNGHLALRTTFAYDLRGNLTSQRSPRGFGRTDDVFHTRMTYDAARRTSRPSKIR